MTLEIKHGFASAKADGTDATLIQPSHWNSAHALALTGPALVGRTTGTQGAAAEITLGTGLDLSGDTLSVTTTKSSLGLGSVDNTADSAKPVSTAQALADTAATAAAVAASAPVAHVGAGGTAHANAIAAGAAGFMTGADKTKLDGIAAGADVSPVATAITVATSRAIAATDFECILLCASGITITLPNDATLGVTDASYAPSIAIYAAGATVPTLDVSAVTVRGTAPTVAQYGLYGIVRVGSNEWAYV